MSMTRDRDHQALDINIGRVIELYIRGILTREAARDDLIRYFDGPVMRSSPGEVGAYILRVLDLADKDVLDANQARRELVRATSAAQGNDTSFLRERTATAH